MKLIIEKIDDTIYVYMETKKHFKRVNNQRGKEVDPNQLSNNCIIDLCIHNNEYMVFDIKKPKKFNKATAND